MICKTNNVLSFDVQKESNDSFLDMTVNLNLDKGELMIFSDAGLYVKCWDERSDEFIQMIARKTKTEIIAGDEELILQTHCPKEIESMIDAFVQYVQPKIKLIRNVPCKNYVIGNEISLDEFRKKETNENTVVINIKDGIWTVLGMIEYWENAPKEMNFDPYRFQVYSYGNWELDKKHMIPDNNCPSLVNAVVEQQGLVSGGIVFMGEDEDRCSETMNQLIADMYEEQNPIVLELSDEAFMEYTNKLTDGLYIFVIK